MQPLFMVDILVLQAEGLVSAIRYLLSSSFRRPCKIVRFLTNLRLFFYCRHYRSSLLGCRFGRSGSSGFVVYFRRLRLSNCIPTPKVSKNWMFCADHGLLFYLGLLKNLMKSFISSSLKPFSRYSFS